MLCPTSIHKADKAQAVLQGSLSMYYISDCITCTFQGTFIHCFFQ